MRLLKELCLKELFKLKLFTDKLYFLYSTTLINTQLLNYTNGNKFVSVVEFIYFFIYFINF